MFGCLLPAPWLGVLTGFLLAFGPAEGLPSPSSPLVLAIVHCLVLGMLAPIMVGALFQIFPVVAGQTVPGAKRIAPFVALGSVGIALGLCGGFLFGSRLAFTCAMVLAACLYGAIVIALATAASQMDLRRQGDATLFTLRWIAAALLVVIALGILLAGSFAAWWNIDLTYVLRRHVAWGTLGWIASLVLGIASTVVPMFWQTARPRQRWQRYVPALLWVLLMAFFLPLGMRFEQLMGSAIALLMAVLAVQSLKTLWWAKRRFDPAWRLWMGCATCWLLAATLFGLQAWFGEQLPPQVLAYFPWWIGVLALVGGAVFPVNAMLGKIIPFLVFLHLRRRIALPKSVPSMQIILPPQRLRWQANSLIFSLCALLSLPFAPHAIRVLAGLSFAFSQALLASFLLMSLFRYRRELRAALFASKT